MSRDKTRSQAKVRNVADGEIAPRQTSNKYHYAPDKTKAINRSAPQSVRQKRADEWADIEAMENRERKELDAQQYREYMDAQAEKAAWKEDKLKFCELGYVFSFFLMCVVFSLPISLIFILIAIFNVIIWRKNFYDTLRLRGGSSLTPRGKGDKR